MAKVRFISDLHLGHKSICNFAGHARGDCRNVDEHDEWIVKQWNSVVSKNDLVWVLGDVAFNKHKLPLLNRMKGNKHLILGNHDKFSLDMYRPYFNRIHGFQKYKGIWLSHAPIHSQELRGLPNVHGHLHLDKVNDPRYLCVSVEHVHGRPISFDEIKIILGGVNGENS